MRKADDSCKLVILIERKLCLKKIFIHLSFGYIFLKNELFLFHFSFLNFLILISKLCFHEY